jgi:chorismate dehydratase
MNSSSEGHRDCVRVGAVTYLNTKPLVYGLEHAGPRIELSYNYPSCLADQLRVGTIDVGLIPSVEFLRDPAYTIVSDACIACRGPVLSVKLLSRVPFSEIRSLALDEGSRTSALLTRLLLWERFRIEPELLPLRIEAAPEAVAADAALVIGDRAIHAAQEAFSHRWDLGAEWCRWAGLPFVFAMWVARRGVDVAPIARLLNASRDEGVGHLQEIAEEHAGTVGLTVQQTRHYLEHNLHFHLGSLERRGLAKFFNRLTQRFGIKDQQERERNDCTTA